MGFGVLSLGFGGLGFGPFGVRGRVLELVLYSAMLQTADAAVIAHSVVARSSLGFRICREAFLIGFSFKALQAIGTQP